VAVLFDEAVDWTFVLVNYLGMLAGRPQNLLRFLLRASNDPCEAEVFTVYWSMPPRRDTFIESEVGEVLLDGAAKPTEFATVLANWLVRNTDWHDARSRFFASFRQQRFDVARLVGAANMFDILPASAVPQTVELSSELAAAAKLARETFAKLPESAERASILSALGRLGTPALKHKIRHRVKVISDVVGERFPELTKVTDEAVNCRNHYVHGSAPSFDYDENFDCVTFFTRTLEFVFAASDLVEAGWNIKEWLAGWTAMRHPFDEFRIDYKDRLQRLKALLPVRQQ
jgi:hypothetical protein